MTSFTVDAVGSQVKDVPLQHGQFKAYKLTLGTPEGQVDAEWLRKADSPAPQVGQVLEGTLEDGQYGRKFKPTARASFQRSEDPKRTAAIQRMWAMDHAMQLVRLGFETNTLTPPQPQDYKGLWELVVREADRLERDVQRARNAV